MIDIVKLTQNNLSKEVLVCCLKLKEKNLKTVSDYKNYPGYSAI